MKLRQFTNSYMALLRAIHSAGGVPCETYPELFFPEDIPNPEVRATATKAAKSLCHSCPVIDKCFEFALETNQRHGVWGGTSPNERI